MSETQRYPGITILELFAKLRALPLDTHVALEGCDCIGECFGVDYAAEEGYVLLTREDGVEANERKIKSRLRRSQRDERETT